jgi:hypothetical protein
MFSENKTATCVLTTLRKGSGKEKKNLKILLDYIHEQVKFIIKLCNPKRRVYGLDSTVKMSKSI